MFDFLMTHILKSFINLFKQTRSTRSISSAPYKDFSQVYNIGGDFKDDFYTNLQKTIVWTEKIIDLIDDSCEIDYSKVLRTTNPIYDGKPFYKFSDNGYGFASAPEIGFDYKTVLTDALSIRPATMLPQTNLNNMGKILKFEIDVTTHDGAPSSVSGFVDESDIPPIDTWFYITKKYLYCWIPTIFTGKMQDVIDVEILGSYHWLEEINPEVNRQILARLQQNGK